MSAFMAEPPLLKGAFASAAEIQGLPILEGTGGGRMQDWDATWRSSAFRTRLAISAEIWTLGLLASTVAGFYA